VKRWLGGALLAVVGAAGLVAALESLSTGFMHVMTVDGGACGSDGDYVAVHQCSSSDIHLILFGIVGGLVAAVIFGQGSALLGGPSGAGGLSAWGGGFGLLGWDFLRTQNWISGAVFAALAAGGVCLLLSSLVGNLRRGGRPDSLTVTAQPLVRAAEMPGVVTAAGGTGLTGMGGLTGAAGWSAAPVPGSVPTPISGLAPVQFQVPTVAPKPRRQRRSQRRQARASRGPLGTLSWLAASAAGGTIGALVSASLITFLR
jgi:hypothetical protein